MVGKADDCTGEGELVKGGAVHKHKVVALTVKELGFATVEFDWVELFFAMEGSFNVVAGQKIFESSAKHGSTASHFGVLIFHYLIGGSFELDGHTGFDVVE